jgi:hypothetical protein
MAGETAGWTRGPERETMAFSDLTENDRKLYEYIKGGDFVTKKWSTPAAARALGLAEGDVYESMSNLTKHIKDNIWISYKNGGLRVVAE